MKNTSLVLIQILLVSGHAIAQEALTAQQIAAMASPAVVTIGAYDEGQPIGYGSGFLIRENGILVTNLHVVAGADTLRVLLDSGEIYDNVYVLERDDRRDLILLQIPATSLPWLRIGNDRDTQIGDSVFVIGSPLGLEGTFSNGIVSAKRMDEGVAYLQVTAPISEGSSGGPVLNSSGEVVGIATLTFDEAQNVNIAVVARYASDLLAMAGDPVPFANVAAELQPADSDTVSDRARETAELMAVLPEEIRNQLEEYGPYEAQVAVRLLATRMILEEEGWTALDDMKVGMLETGQVDGFELRLSRGNYVALATCDDDCEDLDIYVLGSDEEVPIASDTEADADPGVEFTVRRRGTYVVGASMESCAADICVYAIQLLRE